MFHLKLKEIFNNSIYNVCSNIDSFVYIPEKIIPGFESYRQIKLSLTLSPKVLLQQNVNGLIFFSCHLIYQLFLL